MFSINFIPVVCQYAGKHYCFLFTVFRKTECLCHGLNCSRGQKPPTYIYKYNENNMYIGVNNFLSTHKTILDELKSNSTENVKIYFFMGDISNILDQYTNFIKNQYQMFFTKRLLLDETKKINICFHTYVEIVNKYIPNRLELKTNIIDEQKSPGCEKCGGNIYNMNDGYNECYSCGHMSDNIENRYVSEYYHTENINVNRRTIYMESHHFSQVWDQYHGDLQKSLTNEVLAYIESEIIMRYGALNKALLTTAEIKHTLKLITLPNGNKYYNYIPYIYNKITGKPLMNIRHAKETIVNDFQKLLQVWEKYVKPTQNNRKSFLSNHYVLYQLLHKNGYDEETKHIILLKSKLKLKDHDMLYAKMCDILSWNPGLKLGGGGQAPTTY